MNNVDITSILNNYQDSIVLTYDNIDFSSVIKESNIIRLENVEANIEITKLIDESINIDGNIKGIMILPDDITLEEVEIKFNEKIEENLTNNTNTLDIFAILWQNILVNIPAKISSGKRDIILKGDGWRVISEEEYERQKANNNPFTELSKLFEDGKER